MLFRSPAAPAAAGQDGPDDTPPPILKKVNEMWERAYAARAAEIRMHQELAALVQEIDKAFADRLIENMTLDTRQALSTTAQGFSEKYETIRNSKDWETVLGAAARINKIGEQQIKTTKDRLFREKKEAEREAEKKRLAEEEKKRQEALAAAKAKKIEEEVAAAKAKFQAIVDTGNIRQLAWNIARLTLENLKSETETAEGQIQVDQEMKKIDCMELMQTTLVKNLKDYTFKRGALPGKKSLKGCTVTDVDMSSITYLKKGSKKPVKLPWQTFLRDYHNNLDEIISAFIVKNGAAGGESKGRLSKKDRFNAITGVAFVLRIVCSDDPSSAGYAEKLLKDAVKDYGDYFKQTKEFFPDIDFSDVEAEVSANNT